ncbi:MAG: insulinase family protein [Candidatus Eisenbacteria bacterium]|jgi:predicted Zn-dependent peptidase|nr:insulinase family protein [Candidatus Eisenbacteria bacterium]
MKTVTPLLSLILAALFSFGSLAMAAKPWEELTFPPLSPLRVPDVPEHVLPNGMTLLALEDHEFPLVDVTAYLKAGKVYDPVERAGLAEMAAEVIRTGGSTATSGDDLDTYLESIGASIEIQCDRDMATVSMSCLSQHADAVLGKLAELLLSPALPDEKIELAKVSQRTAIAARNDEPFDMALREYSKVVFGRTSPYASHPEYATIEAISRDDIEAFHRTFYRPDAMVMVVTGDFRSKTMRKSVERAFGGWSAPSEPLSLLPAVPEMQPRGVYYAPKLDVTQSTILLGHLGFRADDPDYPAMSLLDQILGGGFSSRIMNEVRTKRGLAYAAQSIPGQAYPRPGIFGAFAGTKSESTLVSIRVMEHEIARVTEEPVTTEELERARSAILNSFVFKYDSPSKVANRVGYYRFHGYSPDFLRRYEEGVRAATPQTILDAARRKIHPDKLSVLVIGNRDRFGEPLEALGEVTEVDVAIPPPPSTLGEVTQTDAGQAAAAVLLARAAELAGGEALRAVTSLKTVSDANVSIQGMKLAIAGTEIRVLPDRVFTSQKLPFGEIVTVVDGAGGWMRGPQGVQDLPASMVAEAEAERMREVLWVLTHYGELSLQIMDPVTEGDASLQRVFVASDAVKDWVLFFDADGMLAGMDYQGMDQQGPAAMSVRYRGFMEVSGIKVPSAIEIHREGEPFLTGTVTSVEVNPAIDEAIFQRPAP